MISRNPLHNTASTVVYLLFSVAAVIGAVLVLTLSLPGRVDEARTFRSATACPAAPQVAADCLWTQDFTVSHIRLYHGRSSRITATLTSAGGSEWPTEYRNDGPVLENLRDGDRVVGTIWRGQVVKIAARNAEQVTQDSPADLAEAALGTAFAIGPSGLLLFFACCGRLRRRSEPEPTRAMMSAVWLALGLAVAAIIAGIVDTLLQTSLWLIPGIWLPLAALMTWCAFVAVGRSKASITSGGSPQN